MEHHQVTPIVITNQVTDDKLINKKSSNETSYIRTMERSTDKVDYDIMIYKIENTYYTSISHNILSTRSW